MTYRILSFCGGGIRGLLSAGFLNQLYELKPNLLAQTDLFAGTSTGADIISQILAGRSPQDIYNTYLGSGVKMFENPSTNNTQPAYNVLELVAAQRLLHPTDPSLDKLDRKVLFTSFNVGGEVIGMGKVKNWETQLFYNLDKSTTKSTKLVDAVVSSSAMPGMYGSYKGNVDGAFVNHDPTLAAIAAAVENGVKLEEITVICFGTGFMGNSISSNTSNWGAEQWQNGDGNPNNKIPALLINGRSSPILNMCLNGTSTNLLPQLAQMMLGERYAYVNVTLDRVIPENDVDQTDLRYLGELSRDPEALRPAQAVLEKYWPDDYISD